MRPVSGLERPVIQWSFVGIGLLLIGIVAAEASAIRQARRALDEVRTSEMNARLDRQQLEFELAHERATREALALEVARLRGSDAAPAAEPPTLTLTPVAKRGALPPEPSVEQPPPQMPIRLRLLLPGAAPSGGRTVTIALRSWSTGQTLWTRSGAVVERIDRRSAATAFITGDVLLAGAYELLVTAASGDGQPADVAAYEVAIAPPKR
jgi:hypothetical protein